MQLQLSNVGEGFILGHYHFGGTHTLGSKSKFQGEQSGSTLLSPIPKVDFPRFDGNNPCSWILRCQSYFKLITNVHDSQKVILTTMHFQGKIVLWYQNISQRYPDLGWDQFIGLVYAIVEG